MKREFARAMSIATIVIGSCLPVCAAGDVLHEDWTDCETGSLPSGWTTVGTTKTPGGVAAEYFSYGDGMKVMSLPGSETPYAVSYSTTLEGGKVDTRLASPELIIPSSGGILSFQAVNYNPEGAVANKIEVYVHDEATGAEESVFMTRVAANTVSTPATYNVSLGSYAGKEISLIFANEGTNAGLLGIGAITVCEYIGKIYDTTPLFSPKEQGRKLSLSVGLFAPCYGFDARLTTSTGLEETFTSSKDLSGSYQIYELNSKKSFTLRRGEVMEYTLTVTPKMEGATPLEYTGSTGCAEGYPSVCVEEEGTGEKCGYCPAGAAGLDKFTDDFGDRFIGIAVHCTEAFSTGVMEAPSYAEPFLNNPAVPIDGLPAAVLNRRLTTSPTAFNEINNTVSSMVNETSIAETQIESVTYDADSHNVNVKFKTTLALALPSAELNAATVLLADGLTGSDNKWWQKNYYSGTSKQQFLTQADESWWEYMQFYCEYPSEKISPTDMTFNHVAMGIYPDYYGAGCPLKSDWSDAESQESEISFEMPMQEEANGFGVQDAQKTSVVVLIFNARTGEIIAADKMDASSYQMADVKAIPEITEPTEVYYIGIDGVRYATAPKGLSIKVSVHPQGTLTTEKIIK